MHEKSYTHLNGKLLPESEAKLPIADRGFRFGDGLFETIRLNGGVPYQWKWHLQRLSEGLAALRITPPPADWAKAAREVIQHNHATDGFLRLLVTRGAGSKGYLPLPNITAHWGIEYLPPTAVPSQPCKLFLSRQRRVGLNMLPANHKLAHGIGSTLALLEAQDYACDESLLLSAEGYLCEAAAANLFWVKDNQLFTPPLSTGCLNGSTRAAILRLNPNTTERKDATLEEFLAADGAFLSNVRLGIWPIAQLQPEGKTFATDHPLIRKLSHQLAADRVQDEAQHRSDWA